MSLLDLLNQQQPPERKGLFKDPRLGMALTGIGAGMSQLGAGQPVNMMPAVAAMQKKQNPVEAMLSNPVYRKALNEMHPQMAEQILMQAMFGVSPPKVDPLAGLKQEKMQLEIERMRNPQADPTSDMREYEYAVSQGYQGTFVDFQRDMAAAGRSSTTINNTLPGGGGMPGLSKLGEGYTYLYNPDGSVRLDESGMPMSAPVPGGPADIAAQEAGKADQRRDAAAETQAGVIEVTAQRAREAAKKRDFGAAGTSLVGNLPWTDSAEVMRQTKSLKDMASASFLNAMRQQSKTGGALGNVTERELDLLSRQAGALDPNSPNFLRDIADYERALLEIVHGGAAKAPAGPDIPDFDNMTADEIADWLAENG